MNFVSMSDEDIVQYIYSNRHESELMSRISKLVEESYDTHEDDVYQRGFHDGIDFERGSFTQGYQEGYAAGEDRGIELGLEKGYDNGYEAGYRDAGL